ncbi:MAG: molybdenum cofactor biosynthesis protein MoaE [Rhodomicrobium sp.]|jgi:molybdopterin synthase catalytic subunit|nr:MAG: molybdenum cofactor biosynthesis protein MoaE [Rhodomicrobium sp.]
MTAPRINRVQSNPFNITEEITALRGERKDIGAIVTFTGTVRDTAAGEKITTMALEHYPGMTEQELEHITNEAHSRWPLQGSTIIHRIGDLSPGDDIVLVITLSAHRAAAFEAAEFLMDFLKSKAPFWKKETGESGNADWVDARDTDTEALTRWQK